MIKLASKCVGFNGLSCFARCFKLPRSRQSWYRFENYRHHNDEWGFKHDWAKLNFVSLAFFSARWWPQTGFSEWKILKKWFSCDKNYKSRAFCSGTHNSSTGSHRRAARGRPSSSELHVSESTHVGEKYWWASERDRKSLEIQFYYTRLARSAPFHHIARRTARIEFIDFRCHSAETLPAKAVISPP